MKNKNKHENEAKKNVFIPIIGAVLLVGALVFAYYKITYAMHNEDTENAQIECNIIPIAPRVQGYVSTIYIKDNQRVYRDWETDRKSTRLNSSHRSLTRMPSSA